MKAGKFLAVILAATYLAGCASSATNLARLEAECKAAPAAELVANAAPVPGLGLGVTLTISEICANTSLVADSEAKIAQAIAALDHFDHHDEVK